MSKGSFKCRTPLLEIGMPFRDQSLISMHNMAYCTHYESIVSAIDSSESKRGVLIFAIFKVGDIIVPEEIRHFHILLIVTNF